MTDSQVHIHFNKSTRLFADKKYEEGLEQIQKCINYCPNNSLFYSNRGLFHVQQNQISKALKDLDYAISLNSLNYVAYFNLFSIFIRQSKYQQALQNICCALSVLYLLKGKQTKLIQDLNKSLQYASNNQEAKILIGLINLQKGNFDQAHKEQVYQFLKRDSTTNFDEFEYKKSSKKLLCSFKLEKDQELENLINQKIQQFNKVYQTVSSQQGIKTKKIKVGNPQQNQTYLTSKISSIQLEQTHFNKKNVPFVIATAEQDFKSKEHIQIQNISETKSMQIKDLSHQHQNI